MKRMFVPAVGLLLLSACNTFKYQEPLDGARARVRFATDSRLSAVLKSYDAEGCVGEEKQWFSVGNNAFLGKDPKRLGIPLWSYNDSAAKEVYVSSAKPVHAMFVGAEAVSNTTYSCGVPFTYSFASNKDYEVLFSVRTNECWVVISEIGSAGATPEKKELAEFTFRPKATEAACIRRFK